MILIKPSYEVLSSINSLAIIQAIEIAGRTAYKSEDRITESSASEFVRLIIHRGHESVLEHEKISVRFICDRGVSHEIVRHRLASFTQESTRYCNYSQKGITFIIPSWVQIYEGEYKMETSGNVFVISSAEECWFNHLLCAEEDYIFLVNKGWKPERARSVLPNSLKTEIVVTANLREWRLIFKLRTASTAHPQMRELMIPLLADLKAQIPTIFDDL